METFLGTLCGKQSRFRLSETINSFEIRVFYRVPFRRGVSGGLSGARGDRFHEVAALRDAISGGPSGRKKERKRSRNSGFSEPFSSIFRIPPRKGKGDHVARMPSRAVTEIYHVQCFFFMFFSLIFT